MDNTKEEKSWGESIGGEIGKEVGKEIGKEVEKHFANESKEKPKKNKQKNPIARRIGYVVAIFFSFLFLWVVNSYEAWGWQFITDEWSQIDSIVRFSIYLTLVIYGVFIVYDKKLFYYLGRLAMDAVAIYVSVRMYQVFPFDFHLLFGGWDWLNDVFPWILILGIVGTIIGIVVRTTKLVAGKNIYD